MITPEHQYSHTHFLATATQLTEKEIEREMLGQSLLMGKLHHGVPPDAAHVCWVYWILGKVDLVVPQLGNHVQPRWRRQPDIFMIKLVGFPLHICISAYGVIHLKALVVSQQVTESSDVKMYKINFENKL